MDELLKEEQAIRDRRKPRRSLAFRATPPKVQDRKIARKIARSMTPETSDLINSILEARNFFDEDFPEKEDMSLDPDKFSAKTVSTSKNNLPTRIVQNDQPVDWFKPTSQYPIHLFYRSSSEK